VTRVVVDEATRQLDRLVVERGGQEWLIPADELTWTGGQLTLRSTWRELAPSVTAFVPGEFDALHARTTAPAAPSTPTRRAAMATDAPEGGRLELRREELLVRKQLTEQPVVTDVVRVRRRAAQATEHVEETVRREVADVRTDGQLGVED
jgi:hypothetical protein